MYQCDDSDIKGGIQTVSLEDAKELIAQQRERDKSNKGAPSGSKGSGASGGKSDVRPVGNGTPAGRALNKQLRKNFGTKKS